MDKTEKSVKKLLDARRYGKALKLIDEKLVFRSCMRTCINLKAECLLRMGKYREADSLFDSYNPFLHADEISKRSFEIMIAIKRKLDIPEADRYSVCYERLFGNEGTAKKSVQAEVLKAYRDLISDLEQSGDLKPFVNRLIELNYILNRFTEVAVYCAYAEKFEIAIENDMQRRIASKINLRDFIETLGNVKDQTVCVAEDHASDGFGTSALVKAASALFQNVKYVTTSEENFFGYDNVEVILKKELSDETLSEALLALYSDNPTKNPYFLFAKANRIKEINERKDVSSILEMFFRHYEEIDDNRFDCLLLADYLRAASYKMKIDVKKLLYAEPEVDFSVIIPIRNNVLYLPEVLKTCLSQEFGGTMEVLISDNSDADNHDVADFIAKQSDKRLRYIHTPYVLTLAKSFEFAYLNSKGKYQISLGADDGLLKDALKILKRITDANSGFDIIQCNRFVYYWNNMQMGCGNKIYYDYTIDRNVPICKLDTSSLRRGAILGAAGEMRLPYMYQQTVKKSYWAKVYEKTGKLAYGESQDIYNGVLNLFLEEEILYINAPLIIAGMTPSGIGFDSRKVKTMVEFSDMFRKAALSYREKNYFNLPYRNFDFFDIPYGTVQLIYIEFLKVDAFLLAGKSYKEPGDEIIVLKNILSATPVRINDENYFENQLLSFAKKTGDDIYREFNCALNSRKDEIRRSFSLFGKMKNSLKDRIKNDKNLYKIYKKVFRKKEFSSQIDCDALQIKGIYQVSEYLRNFVDADVSKLQSEKTFIIESVEKE